MIKVLVRNIKNHTEQAYHLADFELCFNNGTFDKYNEIEFVVI